MKGLRIDLVALRSHCSLSVSHLQRVIFVLLLAASQVPSAAQCQDELIASVESALRSEDYTKAVGISKEIVEKYPHIAEGYHNFIYAVYMNPPHGLKEIQFVRDTIREFQARKLPDYDHDFIHTVKRDTFRWESTRSLEQGDPEGAIEALDRLHAEGDPLSRTAANVLRGGVYATRYEQSKSRADAQRAKNFFLSALSDKESLRGIGDEKIIATAYYTLSMIENNAFGDFTQSEANIEAALAIDPSNEEYKEILSIVRENRSAGKIKWISIKELAERLGLD